MHQITSSSKTTTVKEVEQGQERELDGQSCGGGGGGGIETKAAPTDGQGEEGEAAEEAEEEEEEGGGRRRRRKREKLGQTGRGMTGLGGNWCAGCREQIRDRFMFSVIDLHWHQDCVQCCDCSSKLNEKCYTVDGKLYCKLDYWRRFGPKCFACREPIERCELVQKIKGNRVYHLKCFTCNGCQKQLKAGEQLHLIDGKRLLCKQDYHQFSLKPSLAGQNKGPGGGGGGGGGGPGGNGGNNGSGNSNGNTGNTSNGFRQEPQQTYFQLTSSQQMSGQQADKISAKFELRPPAHQIGRKTSSGLGELQELSAGVSGDEDELELAGGEYDYEEEEEEDGDGCEDGDEDEEEDGQEGEEEQDEGEEGGCGLAEASRLGANLAFEPENSELENEENRLFSSAGGGGGGGLAGPFGHESGQQKQAQKRTGKQQLQLQPQQVNAAKRKRRRRQRLADQNGATRSRAPLLLGGGGKKLAGRNGESILNGSLPAGSILAGVQPGQPGGQAALQPSGGSLQQQQQQVAATAGLQCQPAQSRQSFGSHNKSLSSAASTASNSSTSSSVSLSLGQLKGQPLGGQQTGNSAAGGQHQSAPNGSAGGHKPTRVRTVLNEKQLQTLRDCYNQNSRPDALMKEQLVDMTGLTARVIRVWFQVSSWVQFGVCEAC